MANTAHTDHIIHSAERPGAMMPLFEFDHLCFTYPEAGHPALDTISLALEEGEFALLCGQSGCGKSTLLRHMKTALTPYGKREGQIRFRGQPLDEVSQRHQASAIGFVMQNPDNQIVTEKVWHELAYGLESLGMDTPTIRLRVGEMASFFGIQGWYHQSVQELSGGQKQLLNLASVMAMQPQLLLLDEPTSQLDPIAAADFLATLKKINNEIGTTILLSEHRLEEAMPLSDRSIVMEKGRIITNGPPRQVGAHLKEQNSPMLSALPSPTRLYFALDDGSSSPLTVREGRQYIDTLEISKNTSPPVSLTPPKTEEALPLISAKDVWFRYEKKGKDIIKDFSMDIYPGELCCIVGGNATGKTTALNLISGLLTPYRGHIQINGCRVGSSSAQCSSTKVSMLPQDPQCLFLKNTLASDLSEILDSQQWTQAEREQKVQAMAERTRIDHLLHRHPYDTSEGEQQRAALAKVLLTQPDILLLDEPTKGMDSFFKQTFAHMLKELTQEGVTIVMVSHDIEFCAEHADRCALFFDGGIISEGVPHSFFAGNSFYTTSINRMFRHIDPGIITVKDAISFCRQER